MAFTGTTPPEVKLILHDLMKNVKQKNVYIGCSGNFTTDKLMASMGFDVHSNDVSLYSKLIADIILNEDTELEVIDQELKLIFDKWKDTRYKKLIQVMFAMRLSGFQERKNEYQQAMYNAFVSQSVDYYNNTIEKLQKGSLDFKIKSFSFCDFYEFLKDKKGKGVGISFPPTYKGGYEKIFSYVEKSFNYERAKYNLFDPSKAGEVFEDLLSTDENIIYSEMESIEAKEFSGLDDLKFKEVNSINTLSISDADIELTEMKFLFVENVKNNVNTVLNALEDQKLDENSRIVVGSFEDYIKVLTEVKKEVRNKKCFSCFW